jgi:hypothetical protein
MTFREFDLWLTRSIRHTWEDMVAFFKEIIQEIGPDLLLVLVRILRGRSLQASA